METPPLKIISMMRRQVQCYAYLIIMDILYFFYTECGASATYPAKVTEMF